jgi:molybdate transport system substrate-binding protein
VARRLRAGEPADLIINSASQMAVMAGAGLVEGASIVELGRMRIGLGVQAGAGVPDIATPEALRLALLAAPAIAYSDPASGATTGIHLLRMMEMMGIAETMAPRSLVFAQGLDAAKAVAEGRAALVMTQISEILAVPGVRLVGPLPAAVNLVTPYNAALRIHATERAGALALLRWLRSPEGRARFEDAGFLVEG